MNGDIVDMERPGPVIMSKEDKHPLLPLTIRLGQVLPLLNSATGRVFLAHLATEVTVVPCELDVNAALGAEDFSSVLATARKEGIAIRRGHLNVGLLARAAAIYDRVGSIVGGLTTLGHGPETAAMPRMRFQCACFNQQGTFRIGSEHRGD